MAKSKKQRAKERQRQDKKGPLPDQTPSSDSSTDSGRAEPKDEIRRLNKPLIFGTLAVIVVVGATFHFVRQFQLERNASVLLDQADTAEGEGDLKDAIKMISRYLRLNPEDGDALKRLASLTNRSESSVDAWFRAYQTYETVLIKDPDREDKAEIRWELVKVAMKLRRFRDALTHLTAIRKSANSDGEIPGTDAATFPSHAELCHRQAICNARLGETDKAVAYYISSIHLDKTQIDPYSEVAVLLLQSTDRAPTTAFFLKNPDRPMNRPEALKYDNLQDMKFDPTIVSVLPEPNAEKDTIANESRAVALNLLELMVQNARPQHLGYLKRAETLTKYASRFREGLITDTNETGADETGADDQGANGEDTQPPEQNGDADPQKDKPFNPLDRAEADLKIALKEAPDNAEVLLAAAKYELARADAAIVAGRFQDARAAVTSAQDHASRGQDADPLELQFYLVEAQAELTQIRLPEDDTDAADRFETACTLLQAGVDKLPKARSKANELSDPAERDSRLGDIVNLDVRLRWALCDTKISYANALRQEKYGTDIDDQVQALLTEAKELEALIGEMTAGRVLPGFVSTRQMISDLRTATGVLEGASWTEAAGRLEILRPDLHDEPGIRRRLDLLLAECYQNTNNSHLRIKVFERALRDDPLWVRARMELAVHLVSLKRFDEAIKQYLSLAYESRVGIVPLHIAAIRLQQQLARPKEDRDWRALRAALDGIPEELDQFVQKALIESEYQFQHEAYDQAESVLQAGFEKYDADSHADLWSALARLAYRRPGVAEAERARRALLILSDGVEAVGENATLRMAAIPILLDRNEEQASELLRTLSIDAEKLFDRAEASQLLRELATAHQHLSIRYARPADGSKANKEQAQTELDETFKLSARVAAINPYDLSSRLMTGLIAIDNEDDEAFQRILGEVRTVEGEHGPQGNYLDATHRIENAAREFDGTDEGADSDTVTKARIALNTQLDIARRLLDECIRERPLWAAPVAKLGQLEDLAQNRGRAFDHFRRALQLGMYTQPVVRRVLQQLSDEGRFNEAKDLYREVVANASSTMTGSLARMFLGVAFRPDEAAWLQDIADASIRQGDQQQRLALDGAQKMLEFSGLTREEQQAALGQTLKADSLTAYREAVNVTVNADGSPLEPLGTARIWASYFSALSYFGELDKDTIERASDRLPSQPAYLRPYIQAFGYRMLQDFPSAQVKYAEAIKIDPQNGELRVEFAQFLASIGKADLAREQANAVLAMESVSSESRLAAERIQAVLLSLKRNYVDTTAALEKLRKSMPAQGTERINSLRTIAYILVQRRTFRDKLELVKVMRELQSLNALKRSDRYRLATLLALTRQWEEASVEFQTLYDTDPSDAQVVASVARALIDQEDTEEAETWVARLERLLPNTYAATAMRARLLHAANKSGEATQLLADYLDAPTISDSPDALLHDILARRDECVEWISEQLAADAETSVVLGVIGDLGSDGDLETATGLAREILPRPKVREHIAMATQRFGARLLYQLGDRDSAERIFRRYMDLEARPADRTELVAYVALRDTAEALRLCKPLFERAELNEAANSAVALLREGSPTPAEIMTVDQWLTQAITQHPDRVDITVQLSLADLRIVQGRFDEAESIFAQILAAIPNSIVTLNNLAWLQAARKTKTKDSFEHISRAIRLAGPIATLCDTRGLVQMRRRQFAPALADFEYVLAAEPTATAWYHVAWAKLALNQKADAKKAFRRAIELGMKPSLLEPLEHPDFELVNKELGD